jgi:hypothetical protein
LTRLQGAGEPQVQAAAFAAAEEEVTTKARRREERAVGGQEEAVGFAAVVIHVRPELEKLRQFVAGARARLAELEVS